MLTRSIVIYIGAFLAAASTFFSLGLLGGQYGVLSFIKEFKSSRVWAGSRPYAKAESLSRFIGKLGLPQYEKPLAKNLTEQVIVAISAATHNGLDLSSANGTGLTEPSECRQQFTELERIVKADSKGLSEEIKIAALDAVNRTIESVEEKYSPDHPNAARSRVESNSVERLQKQLDAPFRSEVISEYMKINQESRKLQIKIPEDQKHLGPKPHEIMIFSASNAPLNDPEEAELIYQALQNREEYASHHGYQHLFLNLSRYSAAEYEHPCWLKLPAIQETFYKHPEVKWLWWLDMDAIIMNGNLTIEEHLLHPYAMRKRLIANMNVAAVGDTFGNGGLTPPESEIDPDKIEFIFTHDYLTLNAGSFFLKNTPANQITLDLWGDPSYIYNEKRDRRFERREQDAFVGLYHRHKNIRDRTGVYIQSTMNSYDERNRRPYSQGAIGDFVFHFAGYSNQRDTYLRLWRDAWSKRILPNGTHANL